MLAAGQACALGLGEAVGGAVLGQPLRIEIPLLGAGSEMPASECFRVRPPVTDVGGEFVLRNARVQVVSGRGGARLVVTATTPVREPVVGFAVAAGCGFEVVRDYVLLATLAAEAPVAAPAVAAPPPPTEAPKAAEPAPKPAKPAGETLRIEAPKTLEALAQQKYPAQPKAREKFMRMMIKANPGVLADEGSVIEAGVDLKIPAGLPVRREGPYLGEPQPAKAAAAERPAAQAPALPTPAAKPATPGKDRLVLGAAPEPSAAKLLAEAERLTEVLVEQNKSQDELLANLAKLETDYKELQKRLASMEGQVKRIEAERRAEKEAPKPVSFDIFELLLAVLAGGAVGGGMLQVWQRTRQRHGEADGQSAMLLPAAAPAAAAEKKPFHWPWQKTSSPPQATTAAKPVDLPAAPAMPVVAVATAAPVLPPVAPVAAPVVPAVSVEPVAVIEPVVTVEPAVVVEPPVVVELVVELAAEPPAATAPAVAEDSLDLLSLDFPLATESAAETAVADETDLPEAAPAAQDTAEPGTELASLDLTLPPSGSGDGDQHELLSLDFPVIVPAAADQASVDNHIIEFESLTIPGVTGEKK